MDFKINTYKSPFTLELKLFSFYPLHLIITDVNDITNILFEREIYPMGEQIVKVGFPIVGEAIILNVNTLEDIEGFENEELFKVVSFKKNKLERRDIFINKNTFNYLNLIKTFCFNFNNYEPNIIYATNSGIFRILLEENLTTTPCRIEVGTNLIEVSKFHFDKLSLAEKVYFLCHEYAHNFLNKDPNSETEADLLGLEVYLSMGFPVISTMTAMSSLSGTEQNDDRMFDINNFLKRNVNSIK